MNGKNCIQLHVFNRTIQNDDTYQLIEKFHSKTPDSPVESNITLNEINSYIVQTIISTIYPVDNLSLKNQSIGMELLELKNQLCSNKNTKIIELFSLAEKSKSYFSNKINPVSSSASVSPILKELSSYLKKQSLNKHYSTLSSIMILRGDDLVNNLNIFQRAENDIKTMLNCVKWNPFTVDYWTSRKGLKQHSAKLDNPQSLITLAMNRNYCVDYLEEIRKKSLEKYKVGAYLHWYEKYQVDGSFFDHAFENIHSIVDSYNKMTF